jgi:hypothetical protein
MRIEKAVTPPFFRLALSCVHLRLGAVPFPARPCAMFQGIETSCKTFLGFVCLLKMNIKINKN